MLKWLGFFGSFLMHLIDGGIQLLSMLGDCMAFFWSAIDLAPSFLFPILAVSFAVAIIMWVVNLL